MKIRLLALLVVSLLALGCAGEPEQQTEPAEPAAEESASMDAEAAVDAVRAAYVDHYNAGDADAVAALFTDDAVTLFADGSVRMGRDAILAGLTADMEGNPTAQIDAAETMVFENMGVQRGTYQVDTTGPDGEPMSFGGNWMTELTRDAMGEWKIAAVISNFDHETPAALPAPEIPEDIAPLTEGPIVDLAASYAEHYNMGHASVVAEMYTEDAVAAFTNTPLIEGRAGIEADLETRMEMGYDVAIHTVQVVDLGDGWSLGGGWYELTAEGAAPATGGWMLLATTGDDGEPKIHWIVTNMDPVGEM